MRTNLEAMIRQRAAIAFAFTLLPLMWGCTSLGLTDHYKHTGPVKFAGLAEYGGSYQFERPNGEMFVVYFDNDQRPRLSTGDEFNDISYYDKGEFKRVFVSASYKKHAPVKPQFTLTLGNGQKCTPLSGGGWECSGS